MTIEDLQAERRYLLRACYQRYRLAAPKFRPKRLAALRRKAAGMTRDEVIAAIGINGFHIIQKKRIQTR